MGDPTPASLAEARKAHRGSRPQRVAPRLPACCAKPEVPKRPRTGNTARTGLRYLFRHGAGDTRYLCRLIREAPLVPFRLTTCRILKGGDSLTQVVVEEHHQQLDSTVACSRATTGISVVLY